MSHKEADFLKMYNSCLLLLESHFTYSSGKRLFGKNGHYLCIASSFRLPILNLGTTGEKSFLKLQSYVVQNFHEKFFQSRFFLQLSCKNTRVLGNFKNEIK